MAETTHKFIVTITADSRITKNSVHMSLVEALLNSDDDDNFTVDNIYDDGESGE